MVPIANDRQSIPGGVVRGFNLIFATDVSVHPYHHSKTSRALIRPYFLVYRHPSPNAVFESVDIILVPEMVGL